MKSNFDFLNRYWPALAQIGATAETYVYSDPNACIYKLGMFAERLVQEILAFEHIAVPAVDNTHANRIRILKRAGLLPHEIDNTLYVLRKTRNSAVHIGTDSVDEAKTLLSLTYNLAVWFMETYGDWGYIAPEFVMPSETTHEDLESVIAEQERKIEELTKQLAVVKTAASGKTQKERARRSESVSAMMNWNEAQTRCLIDEQLRLSGWEADTQNLRYSKGTRPVKGRNIAISEWPTNSAFYKNGYADYAFFIGEKLVALMDAKKMSEDVASTIDVQVKDYAAHIKPEDIPHILFNDTDRFSLLYNNLKGRIVQIELFDRRIRFTVDVEIPLTEQDCQNDGIEFIDIIDDVTRIRIDVLDFEEEMTDEDRKKTVVPFQLAYAVSIHKAQGLEYRSVKVVIPSSNAEKITHGIFYTAITRAKEELKIYWSSETMQEVVAGFSVDTSRQKSLAIIKEKLKQNKNT